MMKGAKSIQLTLRCRPDGNAGRLREAIFLRVCPETSSGIAEFSQHEAD
jgi:hypothetical protein